MHALVPLFYLYGKINFRLTSYVTYTHAGPYIAEEIHFALKQLSEQFQARITEPQTPYKKLSLIADYIIACERLHPFYDANTRTFSMLLLNHLLLAHGFPMVIRDNPNHCYAVTTEEFVNDLIKGMHRTLSLAHQQAPYCPSTTKLLRNSLTVDSFAGFLEIEKVHHSSFNPEHCFTNKGLLGSLYRKRFFAHEPSAGETKGSHLFLGSSLR